MLTMNPLSIYYHEKTDFQIHTTGKYNQNIENWTAQMWSF